MNGHSEIVKLLLVAGARRDITNKVEHYTRKFNYISSELATHYYLMNHRELLLLLLLLLFQFGYTGLDLARTNNHIEVVRLLQQPM